MSISPLQNNSYNSYQNLWAKWAMAFKGEGVDADGRQQAYVFKPGEGNESLYTPATQQVGTVGAPFGTGYVSTGFNPFNPGIDTNGEIRSNYGPQGTATAYAHNPELRNGVSCRLADFLA